MADLSWIGANMLEYLKALSRRSVAPAESEAADSGAAQLAPRHQIDLLQFVLDNMAEGVIRVRPRFTPGPIQPRRERDHRR